MSSKPAVAQRTISAIELAELENCEPVGCENLPPLECLTTLGAPADRAIVFRDHFSDEEADAINGFAGRDALFVLPETYRNRIARPALFTEFPRRAFSALVFAMFDYYGSYWAGYEDGAVAQRRLPGSTIMPGSFVHPSATVGEESIVFPGAILGPKVTIGKRALVKPHAVIGLWGFGIHIGPHRHNLHLPHVGGVSVGDDAELGALITVCAGTIHPTWLGDRVKVDDHVHLSHNVVIDDDAQIIAHAEVSGSTRVGKRCILSPNCSTVNGTIIGDDAIVGIAANVTKNVEPGIVVVGNPARPMRPTRPSDRR